MSEARGKLSSGTLLYRYVGEAIEVLLVHPAGNYNRRAPWGIPKGAPDPDETMEDTARRETREETGLDYTDPLTDLGYVDYTRSKKRVHAFAGPAPDGASPRCASWEVDKAEFIEITRAPDHPSRPGGSARSTRAPHRRREQYDRCRKNIGVSALAHADNAIPRR
ncbi:MAG: NUDIX domain-containing protein [Polyangiales bacterium]